MKEKNKEFLAFTEALDKAVEIVCNNSENNYTGYKKEIKKAVSDITLAQKNGKSDGLSIQQKVDDIIDRLTSDITKRYEEKTND